jgi:hypothetical protein
MQAHDGSLGLATGTAQHEIELARTAPDEADRVIEIIGMQAGAPLQQTPQLRLDLADEAAGGRRTRPLARGTKTPDIQRSKRRSSPP